MKEASRCAASQPSGKQAGRPAGKPRGRGRPDKNETETLGKRATGCFFGLPTFGRLACCVFAARLPNACLPVQPACLLRSGLPIPSARLRSACLPLGWLAAQRLAPSPATAAAVRLP
jgi:hypothetical protein